MNELAIVERNGIETVNARELHEFLEVGVRFNDWIRRRIEKYGFVENEDFIAITQKRVTAQGNKTSFLDYYITTDMAKELSMVENNDRGREARRRFIKLEKLAKKLLQDKVDAISGVCFSENQIQQKIMTTLSYSKHPMMQEYWQRNTKGDKIRFDMVHTTTRKVFVFELKNHELTGNDILEKIYTKDYHGAVKRLAGKRKVNFWFVANKVSDDAKEMLGALSRENVKYMAMGTQSFYAWSRGLVDRDFPGNEWYYNNVLDGQLLLGY